MGLRGMRGGGRALGFGGGGYRYKPDGRAEALEGVRIPIWSTKAFTSRWFAPATARADHRVGPRSRWAPTA